MGEIKTRICKTCGIEKDINSYTKRGNYYLRNCKECQRPIDNEISRKTWYKYKESNLKRDRKRSIAWRKKRREKGLCVHCGTESTVYLCRECSIKHKTKMLEYKDKKRKKIIELMGGKCGHCGVSEDINIIFEFHHLENKDALISRLLSRNSSFDAIEKEARNCILLCANCHRKEHLKIWDKTTETNKTGYRNYRNSRKQFKKELVDLLGGKCHICGIEDVVDIYDFHHINKDDKKFNIGYGLTKIRKKEILEELEKCIVVCRNCHRKIDRGISIL